MPEPACKRQVREMWARRGLQDRLKELCEFKFGSKLIKASILQFRIRPVAQDGVQIQIRIKRLDFDGNVVDFSVVDRDVLPLRMVAALVALNDPAGAVRSGAGQADVNYDGGVVFEFDDDVTTCVAFRKDLPN